jgi:hypothetical protein
MPQQSPFFYQGHFISVKANQKRAGFAHSYEPASFLTGVMDAGYDEVGERTKNPGSMPGLFSILS